MSFTAEAYKDFCIFAPGVRLHGPKSTIRAGIYQVFFVIFAYDILQSHIYQGYYKHFFVIFAL
jgi:hypothetical protein